LKKLLVPVIASILILGIIGTAPTAYAGEVVAEIQEYRLNIHCEPGFNAQLTDYTFTRDGAPHTDAFGANLITFNLGALSCPPDDIITTIVLAELPNDFRIPEEQFLGDLNFPAGITINGVSGGCDLPVGADITEISIDLDGQTISCQRGAATDVFLIFVPVALSEQCPPWAPGTFPICIPQPGPEPQTCADCDDLVQQCKADPFGPPDSVCEAFGDDCRAQLCRAIGGDMIQMETTSVLVAGSHSVAAWMIPVLVSAIGIGIVIARKI